MLSLEVVPLPVTDVDRALAFYTKQLVTADSPSRVHKLYLVTTDLEAERAKLIAHGVAVGAIRHQDPVETWAGGWSTGLDPERRDYARFADFADPDGNLWILQERGYRGP